MAATDSLPRFFKVFVSHFCSDSMVIPESYHDNLPRPLPKTATLQGIGGCFWKVAMMRRRDDVYFGQGWAKFVEDNHLSDGDFLTFVYNGDRVFEVSIYGSGGCKEARAVALVIDDEEDSVRTLSSEDTNTGAETEMAKTSPRSRNKGKEKVVEVSDEDSDGEDDSNTNSDPSFSPDKEDTITVAKARKKGKSKLVEGVGSTSNSRCSVRSKKPKLKVRNPEAYLDDPKNVHFETAVKNRKFELFVRKQLVKDYCLKFQDEIYYMDYHKDGKLKAKTATWGDQRVTIKSWSRICKRNKVKKEDGILCELFREQGFVYAVRVHVIRMINL